jgi:HK97 family phage prohead protease
MSKETRSAQSEVRSYRTEVRVATAADGVRTIEGMIPYNSLSCDLGNFTEKIAPGAFADALKAGADVLCLRDHTESHLLGRTKSKTMTLKDSPEGLHYSVRLPKTSHATDLVESIERGDIDAASFGFVCKTDTWTADGAGKALRTLNKVELFEISPCSFAAYPASSVSTRSCPSELRSRLRGTSEKRHSRVLSAIGGSKWAITQDKLATICAVFMARAAGTTMSEDEVRAAMMGVQSSEPRQAGTVAIIPVYGTISNRANMFSSYSGGTSIDKLKASFRAALADSNVTAIVFDVDSPGGTVDGVPEFAAEILAARSVKPSIAVANTMAASAAYWIASAAGRLVVTPSGEVGSIGVYMMHEDWSDAMAKEGVEVTFIKAGKFKTEGNPYQPLSGSTEAYWQKGVDATYADFIAAVAVGRGVDADKVLADFGQARMVSSADALAAGMVDAIATLDQVLAELGTTDPRVDGTAENAAARTIAAEVVCDCECAECRAGNCAACSDDDCDSPGCPCDPDDDDNDGDDTDDGGYSKADQDAYRARMELELKLRGFKEPPAA